MRTLTLNRSLAALFLTAALAGCPGDSDDDSTTNTTPAQTDPSMPGTTTSGTTGEDPTTSTTHSTHETTPQETGTEETGPDTTPPQETGTEETGPDTTPPQETGTEETGHDTTTGIAPLSFALDIYPNIISPSCGCHIAGAGGLMLGPDATTAYVAMVDAPSGNGGLDYVEPLDPTASYMFRKVSGTHLEVMGGAGAAMPLGGMLSFEQQVMIEQWITAGALP